MFNSVILSIAITLIFVYLVLAIMVTGVNETWFTFTRSRARQLEKFLGNLFFDSEWKTIFAQIMDSPFITVLKKGKDIPPAIIPAKNFVSALLTYIGKGKSDIQSILNGVNSNTTKGEFYKMLESILSKPDITIEEVRIEIEQIFNSAMDRLSGWYTRNAKIMSFAVAFVICAALNIDSINIVNHLWKDSETGNVANVENSVAYIEQAMKHIVKDEKGVHFAGDSTGASQNTGNTRVPAGQTTAVSDSASKILADMKQSAGQVKQGYAMLSDIDIPLGWKGANIPECTPSCWLNFGLWMLKILGILLTAFATSLGAPFWFDLLSRVTPIKKKA